jgi:hypothetical protein
MASWTEKEIGTEECPACGAVYKVKIINMPLTDENLFTCRCGHVMRAWKGTLSYSYEPGS